MIAYGRHKGLEYVPVGPAKEHLRKLRALGLSPFIIRDLTGISTAGQYRILHQTDDNGVMLPKTAAAILALDLNPAHANPNAAIDSTGTARRLQALIAMGWSQRELAKRLNVAMSTLHRILSGEKVAVKVAKTISDAYDVLWSQPAPKGISRTSALRHAALHNFYPPLAWDDDTIDDPTARPHGEWRAVA
jgi:transcriptional regulator with XRE-family HTH domain